MISGKARQAFFVAAVLTALASAARAETTDPKKQEAKLHYEKASRLYDVGKFGEAIAEYETAYLLVEDPALLYNIGQAYRLWDRPDEAARAYKNYLRKRPDASNRVDVEKRIAELEKVIEERRRAGISPGPVPAAPSATTPGSVPPPVAVPGQGTVSGPAGASKDVSASPSAGATATPAAGVSGAPVPPPARPSRILPFALIGAGGVCLLTSLAFGAVAAANGQKVVDASNKGQQYDPAWQSNGQGASVVAVLVGMAGLVAGGTGTYLLLRSRSRSGTAAAGAGSRAAVFPLAGPGFAGGGAVLSF